MFTTHHFCCLESLMRLSLPHSRGAVFFPSSEGISSLFDDLRRLGRNHGEAPLRGITNHHSFPPASRGAHWLVLPTPAVAGGGARRSHGRCRVHERYGASTSRAAAGTEWSRSWPL